MASAHPLLSSDKKGSKAMTLALEMVDSIGRSGLVMVPDIPTPEMIRAGAEAGGVDGQTIDRIWNAMIAVQE